MWQFYFVCLGWLPQHLCYCIDPITGIADNMLFCKQQIACCDSTVFMMWLGLAAIKHLDRVRKRSCLHLKYQVLTPQTWLEIVLRSLQKYLQCDSYKCWNTVLKCGHSIDMYKWGCRFAETTRILPWTESCLYWPCIQHWGERTYRVDFLFSCLLLIHFLIFMLH